MSPEVWSFAVTGPGVTVAWLWSEAGAPDVAALHPVRKPSSGDFSRHVPVTAYSATTRSHHELESGLELGLLRKLDRDPNVVWLLAQPTRVTAPGPKPGKDRSHVPDLLALGSDGEVTIWDARPSSRQDELFARTARHMRSACESVGWRYEIFAGHRTTAERLNEHWLAAYRRQQPWHQSRTAELRDRLGHPSFTVADLYQIADVDGELIDTFWHLVWAHVVSCDLTRRLRLSTTVTWTEEHG